MKAARKRVVCLSALLMLSTAGASLSRAGAVSPALSSQYVAITMEDVRQQARVELQNALAAGRLSQDQGNKFTSDLNNASSLGDVEHAWSELEASAQQAKALHPSIDNLMTAFLNKLDQWQKNKIVTEQQLQLDRDRITGIKRIKKQFQDTNHFYDFWEYVVLAIDLASLEERVNRALSAYTPPLETLDELLLRTDNYIARDELCARQLTVYKSFEVEPDTLRGASQKLYQILKDRAHSRIETPQVKDALYSRLHSIQYEACKVMPSEEDVDKAISEVQRLLDSGAKNGHLGASDDVRVQHELELIKEIKKAYPGPNPGIDLVEKELRAEEIRFVALDLRHLQDWLGRVLRKDGEVNESREQVFRAVRRVDLAYFSHRITKADAVSLLTFLNNAIHDSSTDDNLTAKCRELQGRMDMMVSDFSMVPAQTTTRLQDIGLSIARMNAQRENAAAEKERISGLLSGVDRLSAAEKYGVSFVAASEAEMLRKRVREVLKQTEPEVAQ